MSKGVHLYINMCLYFYMYMYSVIMYPMVFIIIQWRVRVSRVNRLIFRSACMYLCLSLHVYMYPLIIFLMVPMTIHLKLGVSRVSHLIDRFAYRYVCNCIDICLRGWSLLLPKTFAYGTHSHLCGSKYQVAPLV